MPTAPPVLDTDTFEWGCRKITQSKGREACIDLMSHYNGSSKSERCIASEINKLSNLFYNNEMTCNIETLSTNLKDNFDTTEKYGEGISKIEKVRTFIDKIRMTNNNFESAINF